MDLLCRLTYIGFPFRCAPDPRLEGPHASPKGLRHGFGVAAVTADAPLNLVQKWLAHAQLSTTAIYADTVGAEEGHRQQDVVVVSAVF